VRYYFNISVFDVLSQRRMVLSLPFTRPNQYMSLLHLYSHEPLLYVRSNAEVLQEMSVKLPVEYLADATV